MNNDSEYWMSRAIIEAKKAWGKCHPNPAVGAVIVKAGKQVAEGHTQEAGFDHAEVVALKAFKSQNIDTCEDTCLYVTLEPCSTMGLTPPCTDAILDLGIKKVVVGAIDLNPCHEGNGLELLRKAGVEVSFGILEDECEDLNLIFNYSVIHQSPFVAGKIATTLDGKIATRGGLSKWITSDQARQDVMKWRRYFPAIAVGAGTVIADNPRLTSRIEGEGEWCPIRFVFDRNLVSFNDEIPDLYQDEFADKTIVITSTSKTALIETLSPNLSVKFWALKDESDDGGVGEFKERCFDENINGVYLEGGAHLLSSFLKHQELDYLFSYRAPKLLADAEGLSPFMGEEPREMSETIRLKAVKHASFGEDQLMRGFIDYNL